MRGSSIDQQYPEGRRRGVIQTTYTQESKRVNPRYKGRKPKRDYKQNKLNSDLENTEWLGKAANTWRVLNTGPDSAICERKECLLYGVCNVSQVSVWLGTAVWSVQWVVGNAVQYEATVCVVQESVIWKGNLWWRVERSPWTGFVTPAFLQNSMHNIQWRFQLSWTSIFIRVLEYSIVNLATKSQTL